MDNVKSAKTHLKRVIGDTKLTFEEMVTLLTQIEPCLNSRPLVAINNDDDGTEALTSGHSLIGQPLFSSGLHTLISYWIPPSAMATVSEFARLASGKGDLLSISHGLTNTTSGINQLEI